LSVGRTQPTISTAHARSFDVAPSQVR